MSSCQSRPRGDHLRAVECEQIERAARAERDQKTADDHARDVRDQQQRRDVDRVPPDPGNRLVIIRSDDAEHNDSKRRRLSECKRHAARGGEIFLGRIGRSVQIKCPPAFRWPAPLWKISLLLFRRPIGLGENKPANQAVLDWVHEVADSDRSRKIFSGATARRKKTNTCSAKPSAKAS